VKLSDLRHIKFSTLENKIEIANRQVKLPAMQIKSNAMDLYMSGTHSFDNVIDYQFRISLADLMVRKFLGGNKQQDNYETDAEGGVNVYVSMTGTVDDPILKYNKREAKQKLQDSGLEQQRFIDIFKRDPEETMFHETETPEVKPGETDTEDIEFIEFDEEEDK
ncbi:MAG TPA: AsmA-like C-terminal region-containing protein, partial [Chitinophagales bacterium]|nr:AsmA-like C-terminal region-containing protein [Chitinophagales bacterium]